MTYAHKLTRQIARTGLLLALSATSNACIGMSMLGSVNWKEEVLQQDGSSIVVERAQTFGGRSEIGQPPPIKEHILTFVLPGSNSKITWVSEYGEDIGRTNFNLLALHVLNGTPYVVASPNLCLSYNKWGRPNPPYVFFKYDDKEWRRITLSDFPAQLNSINVALSIRGREGELLVERGFTSAETIKRLNASVKPPEFQSILHTPLANYGEGCGEMFYDGKGGWRGIGWFRDKPSLEACVKYCGKYKIESPYCPCATLFKGK